jgi:hypothetical protein
MESKWKDLVLLVAGAVLTFLGTATGFWIEAHFREREQHESEAMDALKGELQARDRTLQLAIEAFKSASADYSEELYWLDEYSVFLARAVHNEDNNLQPEQLTVELKKRRDEFAARRLHWAGAVAQRAAMLDWTLGKGTGGLYADEIGNPVSWLQGNLERIEFALIARRADQIAISEIRLGGTSQRGAVQTLSAPNALDAVHKQKVELASYARGTLISFTIKINEINSNVEDLHHRIAVRDVREQNSRVVH